MDRRRKRVEVSLRFRAVLTVWVKAESTRLHLDANQAVKRVYVRKWFVSPAVVAWVAVAISFLQLLLSAPLLSNFYMSGNLSVSKMKWDLSGPSAGRFFLSNIGRGNSRNVEVGLLIHPNGYIQLTPDLKHVVECQEKVIAIRNCRISIKQIPPGERVMVSIFRGAKAEIDTEKRLEMLISIGMTVPRLEYVYSDDGVTKASWDIQNNTEYSGQVIR